MHGRGHDAAQRVPVMTGPPSPSPRPLDLFSSATAIVLCLSWGVTQVAVKLVLPEVPPFIQAFIRSGGGAFVVFVWTILRGVPLLNRDGTLRPGLIVGLLFGFEFLLIFAGLRYTTATRGVVLLYTAPFFVALGSRWFLPAERLKPVQYAGLALSFAGVLLALGGPAPAPHPLQLVGDLMLLAAAAGWGLTTLVIKTSALAKSSFEKTTLYQLGTAAVIAAAAALIAGETVTAVPSGLSIGLLAYQALWGGGLSLVAWFALIVRYSASRVSAFTFITPVFGVALGHFAIGDPLTPVFLLAVVLLVAGLVLVNRRT